MTADRRDAQIAGAPRSVRTHMQEMREKLMAIVDEAVRQFKADNYDR
jgi:hypothetical protein